MSSKAPNVILVAADGVGWGDVGYGGADNSIPTPHIDELSSKGVRFNRYYAQSTSTASRASLLTGRYASNTGQTRNCANVAAVNDVSINAQV